jgi:hypothetical protein
MSNTLGVDPDISSIFSLFVPTRNEAVLRVFSRGT